MTTGTTDTTVIAGFGTIKYKQSTKDQTDKDDNKETNYTIWLPDPYFCIDTFFMFCFLSASNSLNYSTFCFDKIPTLNIILTKYTSKQYFTRNSHLINIFRKYRI